MTSPIQQAIVTAGVLLYPGWNLISLPLVPLDASVGAVLHDVPVLGSVFEWRSTGQRRVTTFQTRVAYWVCLGGDVPATLTVVGREE